MLIKSRRNRRVLLDIFWWLCLMTWLAAVPTRSPSTWSLVTFLQYTEEPSKHQHQYPRLDQTCQHRITGSVIENNLANHLVELTNELRIADDEATENGSLAKGEGKNWSWFALLSPQFYIINIKSRIEHEKTRCALGLRTYFLTSRSSLNFCFLAFVVSISI